MKIGILGCGKMAEILTSQMNFFDKDLEFFTFNPRAEKSLKLAEKINGTHCEKISDLPGDLNIYFFCCRPQNLNELALELTPILNKNSVIISILAGTSIELIKKYFTNLPVLRIMPNLPNSIQQGVNLFYFSPDFPLERKTPFISLFEHFSSVFTLDKEEEIDLLTPITGSGPAYIFEWVRIFSLWPKQHSAETHLKLIIKTFQGALSLLEKSGKSAESLRNDVTSRGGITKEVLDSFKSYNLEKIFLDSLEKGLQKAQTMNRRDPKDENC